jgi:hypothetical protein
LGLGQEEVGGGLEGVAWHQHQLLQLQQLLDVLQDNRGQSVCLLITHKYYNDGNGTCVFNDAEIRKHRGAEQRTYKAHDIKTRSNTGESLNAKLIEFK